MAKMALWEDKEGSGQFLRGMTEGANLGQVGRLSYRGEDSAGIEDTDFVRAQIHNVDFFV